MTTRNQWVVLKELHKARRENRPFRWLKPGMRPPTKDEKKEYTMPTDKELMELRGRVEALEEICATIVEVIPGPQPPISIAGSDAQSVFRRRLDKLRHESDNTLNPGFSKTEFGYGFTQAIKDFKDKLRRR